jgi:hypothetical protein
MLFPNDFLLFDVLSQSTFVTFCFFQLTEVGIVTSNHKSVTHYRSSHNHGAITIKSDNVSLEPRAITLRSDNDFDMFIEITIKSDIVSPQF